MQYGGVTCGTFPGIDGQHDHILLSEHPRGTRPGEGGGRDSRDVTEGRGGRGVSGCSLPGES